MQAELKPYQQRMVDFMVSTPRCACWADMGLGKTLTTLTALVELFDRGEIGRVLVVAPLRVARTVWPAEIAKWDHLRHLRHAVATGSQKARQAALASGAPVVIINRENVEWLVSQYTAETWPFDCVVLDEASSFKSHGTRRFKALRKALPKIERMIQLTGTPAPNSLLNLWPQVFLLDGGQRLGRTFTAFRVRYFESDYMGYQWTLRDGARERIHQSVADICMSLQAADYLDMPERVHVQHEVELPENAWLLYRTLEKDFLAEVEGKEILVQNAAVLVNKLLQASSGFVYDGSRTPLTIHEEKLDCLADIIEAANGEPVLVGYQYQAEQEAIRAKFPQARLLDTRPETVEAWNRGEIQLLLAHPASAGHGLNLQAGGSVMVWFSLPWSLELYQQFNARLHRQGQTKPVFVHHILAKDTVDLDVLAALGAKDINQQSLIDAVKARVEGVAA